MKTHKVTKKEFKQLKIRYAYWLKELGITGWGIRHEHKEMESKYDIAKTTAGWSNREVCITLNTRIAECLCEKGWIENTAIHEVIDLLTARLRIIATERYIASSIDVIEANHEITQVLTNYLLRERRYD